MSMPRLTRGKFETEESVATQVCEFMRVIRLFVLALVMAAASVATSAQVAVIRYHRSPAASWVRTANLPGEAAKTRSTAQAGGEQTSGKEESTEPRCYSTVTLAP